MTGKWHPDTKCHGQSHRFANADDLLAISPQEKIHKFDSNFSHIHRDNGFRSSDSSSAISKLYCYFRPIGPIVRVNMGTRSSPWNSKTEPASFWWIHITYMNFTSFFGSLCDWPIAAFDYSIVKFCGFVTVLKPIYDRSQSPNSNPQRSAGKPCAQQQQATPTQTPG